MSIIDTLTEGVGSPTDTYGALLILAAVGVWLTGQAAAALARHLRGGDQ